METTESKDQCAACDDGIVVDRRFMFSVDDDCTDRVGLCEKCWCYKSEADMCSTILKRRSMLPASPAAEGCGGDSGRYNGNDLVRERTMAALTDTVVGRTRVEAARKRNIAALARELDDGAGRRARVSRFDGGPWQQWPKGDDRNEP